MKPTIVYKKNGPHRGPKGSTYQYKGVSDEATLKALIQDGWFSDLYEAVAPKEIIAEKEEAPLESIEDLLKEGKLEPKEIAEKHNVHVNTVYKVKRDLSDAVQ
jgi:hypothetical protein